MRAAWWKQYHGDWDPEISPLEAFWNRVATTEDRLVVWMGRHSALELAFFLAWTERLGERSYGVIDVTGLQLPYNRPDRSATLLSPAPAVSILPPYQLATLIGSGRQVSDQEKDEARLRWAQLRAENAPFRVVTPEGMVSAPIDYFDPWLIEQATTEWRKVARVIGGAMGANFGPYYQVGDIMLFSRIVALIDQGKLLADGDPSDMHVTRVRLPT